MTEFKAVSGGWTKPSEGTYKGLVDASLSARAIAGSETDENVEFYATVKITTGKAAIICNYTVDEDWNEHYVEMVLDPTGDTIKLEAVTRDSEGTETNRVTLASRNVNLVAATEYDCHIVSKKLSDGSYAVYGYIDDFLLVEAEDLDTNFQKGMHGLESLGVESNYTEYSQMGVLPTSSYCKPNNVKQILQLDTSEWNKYNTEIIEAIISAKGNIDTELSKADVSIPSQTPQNLKDAQAHFAAWLIRRRRDPAGAEVFKVEAEQFLQIYIDTESEPAFKVAQA